MIQKTEFWAAHVKAAGLVAVPASEYAKQHELAVKSLYYWRRKLEGAKPVHQTGIKSIPSVSGNKFVALQVATPRQTHCTLSLPSGLRLEMSVLPSPEWLAILIQSVQR
jgi:hypothetical protein